MRLLLPLIFLFIPIMIVANSQLSDKYDVSKEEITADGKNATTLIFTAKDASNQPIRNLNVRFKRSHEADTRLSAVTEHKRVTITPHIDGQAVERVAAETVTFKVACVDFDESSFSASSSILFTDGQDKVTLAFTAKDSHNQPVRGLVISFNKEKNRPSGSSTILSDITETDGVYRATLTATTKGSKEATSELVDFRLMIDGKPAGVVNGVLLIAPKYYFTVSKDSIAPNYEDESTLTFTAIDGGNQPLHGLAVSFKRDDEEGTILSPIIEKNGVYSATLKGFSAKKVTIEPCIGGQPVAGITEKTVTLSWQ
ncbi:Bacterial Ig-like protein [Candidatus Regiella insecticola 5.15]|uniref:Bacterial Ig-like protein n=2 Tax=Candidatus Regiella insecticola TaxID=138073 RepID=G2GWC6_9ENTR|nr:Bacterial Ig-like protein [Candidatus Regiella insecticola 5.15]